MFSLRHISLCSPCDSQEERDELQDDTESTLPQNIHKEISDHTFVPESTAKNICTKAGDLLKDVCAITAAPIEGEARIVKSVSNTSRPHLVKVLKGGKLPYVDVIENLFSLCGCCSHCWYSQVLCEVVCCQCKQTTEYHQNYSKECTT